MSAESGRKAIFAAMAANLGIAVTKFVAYLLTQSASMLAESIHSLADTGNQVLLLVGARRSQQVADEDHPFGYSRNRYFYAFMVAVVIFTVGAVVSIYEGVEKFIHPHEVERASIAIVVLLISMALEAFSLHTALREINEVRPRGMSVLKFARQTKSPELPVVAVEDIAALTGLVFALFGVSMAAITGDGRWDAFGSIMIGVLLGVVAGFLAIEMHSLLIGEGATPTMIGDIRSALSSSPHVTKVIHLRTMHLGPEDLMVAAKIELDHELDLEQTADAIDDAELRVRDRVPIARLIFVEPDVWRAKRAAEPVPPGGAAEPSA